MPDYIIAKTEVRLANGHLVSFFCKERASAILGTQKELVSGSSYCLQMPVSICLCFCITNTFLAFIHTLTTCDLSELRICVYVCWQKQLIRIYFFNQTKVCKYKPGIAHLWAFRSQVLHIAFYSATACPFVCRMSLMNV